MNHSYQANFVDPFTESGANPDIYIVRKGVLGPPAGNFVISRTTTGSVASLYVDDSWDLRAYRNSGDSGSAKLIFKHLPRDIREEAKWLMFVLMFVVEGERGTGLSVSTLMNYMKIVRRLSHYAGEHNYSIKEVLEDDEKIKLFISELKTRNLLRGLSSLLAHLFLIPTDDLGIRVLAKAKHQYIESRFKQLPEDEQYPVIPPRIFSSLISQLQDFVYRVHEDLNPLEAFLLKLLSDERFGRSDPMQRKLGYRKRDFGPHFEEAASIYGLDALLKEFNVTNLPSLSTFLTRLQHACATVIHIYSGMRKSECLSLKVGALKEEKVDGRRCFRLHGETTKLTSEPQMVSWVTSIESVAAYKILETIALIVANTINLEKTESIPIMISAGYLSLNNKNEYDGSYIALANASEKKREVFPMLDTSSFRVQEEDLGLLEKIDPFRAWESESAFAIGAEWRFTTHQYRRSLAFYVSQSELVSLPSLKRQLKHLSREMTIYYCRSKVLLDQFDHEEHIARLFKKERPTVDATIFIEKILQGDEQMHGALGKLITKQKNDESSLPIFHDDRAELERKFRKGEMAYKATPLGGCTTIKQCDKPMLREMSACIGCAKAVIMRGKLDKTIRLQALFVEELSCSSEYTVEYRTEVAELEKLKSFQHRMENTSP